MKLLEEAGVKYSNDDAGFLLYIYQTFPPKETTSKPPPEKDVKKMAKGSKELKKVFQKAVLHYHPDKQDAEKHGKKWEVLCDEITKMLTGVYECC